MKLALVLLLVLMALATQPAGVYGAQRPVGCSKRVPLYPGYPGYRGNVPGVNGVGDYVCLETLQQSDPSFSRSREDIRNRAAAQRLGIEGEFSDWTWEIWMQIEAARGLGPSCYSCLVTASYVPPTDPTILTKPNDSRVLAGSFTGMVAVNYEATRLHAPTLRQYFKNDYIMRALGFIVLGSQYGRPPTASELVAFYDEEARNAITPGGHYYVCDKLLDSAMNIGGYAPTPATAPPNDQIFTFAAALTTCVLSSPPFVVNSLYSSFTTQVDDWRVAIATGPYVSLADYLRSHWSY